MHMELPSLTSSGSIYHVQMIGLDDSEVVTNTLDGVLSVDGFQFLIGTVNGNSEMEMSLFSCK